MIACRQDQDETSWSCLQAVNKPVWHIPLLCVQWKTPNDGQRNCPKHAEFYSKNKFEKSVHLVGFIVRISLLAWHTEAETSTVTSTDDLLLPHFLIYPCTFLYKNASDWKFANMAYLWHGHRCSLPPPPQLLHTQCHATCNHTALNNVNFRYCLCVRYTAHILLIWDIVHMFC